MASNAKDAMDLFTTGDNGDNDKALVKANDQTAIDIPRRFEVPGVKDLDLSDIVLPRKRMVQHMSQHGEAGEFYDNITEQCTTVLYVVPLSVRKQRVMFDRENVGEGAPLCASDNAIMPRDGMAYEGPCATCPMAQWGEKDAAGKSEPPKCSLAFTYLFADLNNDNEPFLISFMRTSMATAKKINTLIKTKGLAFSLWLGTEEVKDAGKKWFELRINEVNRLTPQEQHVFARQAAALAGVDMSVDLDPGDTLEDDGDDQYPF